MSALARSAKGDDEPLEEPPVEVTVETIAETIAETIVEPTEETLGEEAITVETSAVETLVATNRVQRVPRTATGTAQPIQVAKG